MANKKDAAEPCKFTKEQLLKSATFESRKDALGAIIKDGEMLTVKTAQERLEKFMKGKVK